MPGFRTDSGNGIDYQRVQTERERVSERSIASS